MGDAEQQQLLQLAAAEPEECSRRGMACALGCAGVALLCVFGFLVPVLRSYDDENFMPQLPAVCAAGFVILALAAGGLGLYLCGLFLFVLMDMYVGHSERRKFVDLMLR